MDYLTEIMQLFALKDNWDTEGAPAPSISTVTKAYHCLQWAKQNYIEVLSVDPDVLGGVAIYLYTNKTIWVSILNNGSISYVKDNVGYNLTTEGFDVILN